MVEDRKPRTDSSLAGTPNFDADAGPRLPPVLERSHPPKERIAAGCTGR